MSKRPFSTHWSEIELSFATIFCRRRQKLIVCDFFSLKNFYAVFLQSRLSSFEKKSIDRFLENQFFQTRLKHRYIEIFYISVWNCHLLTLECALIATGAAYFLRPSVNATFDRHPVHRKYSFKDDDLAGTTILKIQPMIQNYELRKVTV